MSKQLVHLAHARSGDKGDKANIALFAPDQATYDLLVREVTAERVRVHFAGIVTGQGRALRDAQCTGAQFCAAWRAERWGIAIIAQRCTGEVAVVSAVEDGDRG